MIENNFRMFNDKFNVNKYLIMESDHWRLSLRPFQATLGSAILSLNRPCENFADITTEESADLKEIVSYTEKRLKLAFSYDKINYLMLMMVDPHLHFHVIPRYSREINFEGAVWSDSNWPTAPDLGGKSLNEEEAGKIIEKIREVA